MSITFYAPSFLDNSTTFPDRKGRKRPTGNLSGMIFTRRFSKTGGRKITAERGVIPFSWKEDTQAAKVEALAKAIEGMQELPDLDENPPITWIPQTVKEQLT